MRARSSSTVSAIGLGEQLPVETKRARLVRRDRAADAPGQLLQPVVIGLPELLDPDFGAADLGHRRLAEAAEDVADAPDGEADGDQSEDDPHDHAAEPVRCRFLNTSKHGQPLPETGNTVKPPSGAALTALLTAET